ncbi:uncharacterized protein G2W53_028545 [Senna tora]|uniref:Uncharacterized protein n=1 Tax=Senna tora TaxID=362788 RepID=A0A834T5L0_9FABA|nr:uncharacterized protein G2W53_028545 [Senna tora]
MEVLERPQWLELCTDQGVKEGHAVVDDGIDVGDVSDEARRSCGDGAGGESDLGEVNDGELEEPAGLVSEAMNEWKRKRKKSEEEDRLQSFLF